MVIFLDTSIYGVDNLTITDARDTSKETILPVHTPANGALAPKYASKGPPHIQQWYKASKIDLDVPGKSSIASEVFFLESSLHYEGPGSDRSCLLIEEINKGDAKWGKSMANFGETSFINGYWEWLEYILGQNKDTLDTAGIYDAVYASLFTYDRCGRVFQAFCEFWCSSTNTLHLPIGEMSISLWDLYEIGGLPIQGHFYDEVVPSAKELTSLPDTIPSSCKYLLAAYHLLRCKHESAPITLESWVAFWFRGDMRYGKPPQRYPRKSTSQPKVTNNPSGIINPRHRLPQEDIVFEELGVEECKRDETFLAALLSCWLCKFVFPIESFDCIRPSTFKVASLMARGTRFSLAVPVLASIYRGLSMISTSSTPSICGAMFPVQYVYGWLGQYFDCYWRTRDSQRSKSNALMVRLAGEKMAKRCSELEARELLTNIEPSVLPTLCIRYDKDTFFQDDGKLKAYRTGYLLSLRSSYLTLRQENSFVVEAYSPHRFARQFNFCQDLPGKLREEIANGTLEQVFPLWESSTRLSTQAKLVIPSRSSQCLATCQYMEWWSKYTRLSLGESTELIHSKKSSKSKGKPVKKSHNTLDVTVSSPKKITPPVDKFREPAMPSQLKVASVIVKNHSRERCIPSDEESDSNSRDRNPKRIETKHRSPININEEEEVGEHLPNLRVLSTMNARTTSVCLVEGPRSFDLLTKCGVSLESGELPTLPSGGNNLPISSRGIPLCQPCSLPSVAAEPSSFEMTRHMTECESAYVQTLWTGFARKLAKDPLHLLSRLTGNARELLDKIEKFDAPNFRSLQRLVDLFFADIKSYDLIRSKNEASLPGKNPSESLEKVVHRLSEVEKKYTEKTKIFKSLEERLNNINSEIEKLTAEKKYVEEQMLLEGDQLSRLQNELLDIQEEKSSLNIVALLSRMEQTLESSRDELVKFQLF